MPPAASCSVQATDTAISATRERSIPRPMTTSPMATPRMPRIETLRTRLRRLFVGQKAWQRDREDGAQQQRQTEDDLFLAQPPEDFHLGLRRRTARPRIKDRRRRLSATVAGFLLDDAVLLLERALDAGLPITWIALYCLRAKRQKLRARKFAQPTHGQG